MIILFQNILFSKEFLACNGFFGLFTKVKRGSGNSLWFEFSAWFCNKNVFSLILYQWTKFQSMSYLFPFLRYQTKCFIKFLFRQLMTSKTLRFLFHQPLKQWLTGRKKGEDGNTKMWISRERKELFRWNKKYFSKFLKGYQWEIKIS